MDPNENYPMFLKTRYVDNSNNVVTLLAYDGFSYDAESVTPENVSWNTLYDLKEAATAIRQSVSANILTIDDTLECNDNNLAKTRTAVLSAPPLVEPSLVLTDITNGVVNTINSTGYTTKNSVQNSTHYLNFSDSSSTGVGAIQKTSGISCNPSTNTLSATTLTATNISVNSPYNFSVVSIFANAVARDIAIPSPYAGQIAFLTGSNKLQYWNTFWYNVNVAPNTPIVTGFTLSTNYDILYVNSSNTIITAPTLDGYTIVRFNPTTTTSGTITLPNTTSVEYLVVAGGGGGAGGGFSSFNGGGGGGGGFLTGTDLMVASTSYAVSVGQGGTAGPAVTNGGNGVNSSLVVNSGTITAIGGAGGGAGGAGLNGGSGGGAGYVTTNVINAGGTGTALQGNNGGSSTTSSPYAYSGGGGGSSAVGSSSNGQGGAGTSSAITGATLFYSGGGGGGASSGVINIGANPLPTGGSGVGGNGGYWSGANIPPTAGTNGRGGGGGGRGVVSSTAGAAGGSGKVVVRFPSYS